MQCSDIKFYFVKKLVGLFLVCYWFVLGLFLLNDFYSLISSKMSSKNVSLEIWYTLFLIRNPLQKHGLRAQKLRSVSQGT